MTSRSGSRPPECNHEVSGGDCWTVALVDPEEGGVPVEVRDTDLAGLKDAVYEVLDIAEA